MKILKFLLIIVLVVVSIGAGFYYVTLHFPNAQIAGRSLASLVSGSGLSNSVNVQNLPPLVGQAGGAVAMLLPKSLPNVSLSQIGQIAQIGQLGQVLGARDSTTTNGSNGSPQPQLLETARYVYCQQVVKDYDGRYGGSSASNISSASASATVK